MHKNYHFIVMRSHMLLHVSAHQRHHQGDHVILTGYLSVCITETICKIKVNENDVSQYCKTFLHSVNCDCPNTLDTASYFTYF
jgi:hypothetical protein